MTTWQTIKRFLEPVRDLKLEYLKTISYPMFDGVASIAIVNITKNIIDQINAGDIAGVKENIVWFVGIALLYILVRRITKYRGASRIRPMTGDVLMSKYYRAYISLENSVIEKFGTGRVLSIMSQGIWQWIENLANVFIRISGMLVKIVFSIILLSSINAYLGLLFGIVAIVTITGHIYFQNRASVYRAKRKVDSIEYDRQTVKIIMSKMEIFQSSKIDHELSIAKGYLKNWMTLNRGIEINGFYGTVIGLLLSHGCKLFLFLLGIGFFSFGSLTLGEIGASITIFMLVDSIIFEMSRLYIDCMKNMIHVEKLWHLFDSTPVMELHPNGKVFECKKGIIELSHMSFSYGQHNLIFDNFDLTLQGQKKTALVGPSGGGKSTLVKLIAGYLKADKGDIIIDKQKLSDLSLVSYYQHIGYLTQDPSVFDGTIRDNLIYGTQGRLQFDDKAALDEVITGAKCEWIYDLPDGFDTEIGERGIRLSGGQKQRLAIAKIMLKNPDIILLDEPTSALDSYNEEQVTQALNNLFKNKTVVVIAHRLQTVKHADDIIYIADGKVVERGTHEELLKLKGEYYKMVELQSGF